VNAHPGPAQPSQTVHNTAKVNVGHERINWWHDPPLRLRLSATTPQSWSADKLGGVRRRLLRAYFALPGVRARRGVSAARAWRRSRTKLFVCHGNICRSPFAERYASRLATDWRTFASAGYQPIMGRTSPDEAVTAAARWQVDLAEHRSCVLTQAMIRWADAIFVFDDQDYRRVRKAHPSARGRVHLLATIEPHGPPLIADPYAGPVGAFEQTYERIAGIIERSAHGR
jgi:protein-tyrosine phosphatase